MTIRRDTSRRSNQLPPTSQLRCAPIRALAQPESSFGGAYLHPDIYSMAAAYLYHIAMNHPFVDGNKRVATVSSLVFLELNDYELDVSEDLLEETVLKVASGNMGKNELTEFFRAYTRLLP